jgi:hypothetical protein
LSFKQVERRHTGNRLSKEVLDVLKEFDLTKKLFCITSDNAGNMGKLMRCLSKRLKKLGVRWKASERHISQTWLRIESRSNNSTFDSNSSNSNHHFSVSNRIESNSNLAVFESNEFEN